MGERTRRLLRATRQGPPQPPQRKRLHRAQHPRREDRRAHHARVHARPAQRERGPSPGGAPASSRGVSACFMRHARSRRSAQIRHVPLALRKGRRRLRRRRAAPGWLHARPGARNSLSSRLPRALVRGSSARVAGGKIDRCDWR